MKKLKTFCALVGTAMLCATPALAYDAPEYSLEGAKKKVEYHLGGYMKIVKHGVDRNKDGKIDLVQENIFCEEQKAVNLYVDDDFDGIADRGLSNKKNGEYGTQVEIGDLKIEDFF